MRAHYREAGKVGSGVMEIPCGAIQVPTRHRKDMGDLDVLAASIATEGLLQPIGITEDNVLVFGERRLRAVREILQQATIEARMVHVSSILAGEYAENEIRKDFTASERVAIGKVLEVELGNRQGQRTDIKPQENFPEVRGRQTRDVAAQKAGFGSGRTYEMARKVVDAGAPELVTAMDAGLSVSAAALIADEPEERQREIVKMPTELRRAIVREMREAAKLPTPSGARRIAQQSGLYTADSNGELHLGFSFDGIVPESAMTFRDDAGAIRYIATARATADHHERYLILLREQIVSDQKRLEVAEHFYAVLSPVFRDHPGITTADAVEMLERKGYVA